MGKKARMGALDLRVEVTTLQRELLGMRVANIYDPSNRVFLFKFSMTDSKKMLLIESGTRLHLTSFARPKPPVPGAFATKLRKHIRDKKLESIEQLGVDRVVKLTFGAGESRVHLFVEFYAAGNLVLTNGSNEIMAVLRRYVSEDKMTRVVVHEKYAEDNVAQLSAHSVDEIRSWMDEALAASVLDHAPDRKGKKKKDAKMPLTPTLENVLIPHLVFGPQLLEHGLRSVSLDPGATVDKVFDIETVARGISIVNELFETAAHAVEKPKGFLVVSGSNISFEGDLNESQLESISANQMREFTPLLLNVRDHEVSGEENGKGFHAVRTSTFDVAIDAFFSRSEQQKVETQNETRVQSAEKKVKKVKKDYESQLKGFREQTEVNETKAKLIIDNETEITEVMASVSAFLAKGMDWALIESTVKSAQQEGDPVAKLITSMDFAKRMVSLKLFPTAEGGEKIPNARPVVVQVDLSLSIHQNAQKYYSVRRKMKEKLGKAEDARVFVQRAAEKRERAELCKTSKLDQQVVVAVRKRFWFEKFHWFISTDGFVVISGRDMQQNELIYRKYLSARDLYVHADVHGAATTVIKCGSAKSRPPLATIVQAGLFAAGRSVAWKQKIPVGAWWVHAFQVSKTAPSGEYLPTGSFMIRGKKRPIAPAPFVFGIGVLFRFDGDEAQKRHAEEWGGVEGDDSGAEQTVEEDGVSDDEESVEDEQMEGDDGKSSDDKTGSDGGNSQEWEPDLSKDPRIRSKEDGYDFAKAQREREMGNADTVFRRKRAGKKKKLRIKQRFAEEWDLVVEGNVSPTALGNGEEKPMAEQHGTTEPISESSAPNPVSGLEREGPVASERRCYLCGGVDHVAADCPTRPTDAETREETSRSVVRSLTKAPLSEDSLTHAIPMVAPLAAVADCTYHAKLVPGQERAGRLVRDFISHFPQRPLDESEYPATPSPEQLEALRIQRAISMQRTLLRHIPDAEMLGIMLSDARLVLDGEEKSRPKGHPRPKPKRKGKKR